MYSYLYVYVGIMSPWDLMFDIAQAKYASGAGAQAESLLLSVLRGWGLEQQQEPQGAALGSQLELLGDVACFWCWGWMCMDVLWLQGIARCKWR